MVLEACCLEAPSIDPSAIAKKVEVFLGKRHQPGALKRPQQGGLKGRWKWKCVLAADRRDFGPRQHFIACDVEYSRQAVFQDEQNRPDHVVFMHELKSGIKSELGGDSRQLQRSGEWRFDFLADHIGEPKDGNRHMGIVLREIADISLDLVQRTLNWVA